MLSNTLLFGLLFALHAQVRASITSSVVDGVRYQRSFYNKGDKTHFDAGVKGNVVYSYQILKGKYTTASCEAACTTTSAGHECIGAWTFYTQEVCQLLFRSPLDTPLVDTVKIGALSQYKNYVPTALSWRYSGDCVYELGDRLADNGKCVCGAKRDTDDDAWACKSSDPSSPPRLRAKARSPDLDLQISVAEPVTDFEKRGLLDALLFADEDGAIDGSVVFDEDATVQW